MTFADEHASRFLEYSGKSMLAQEHPIQHVQYFFSIYLCIKMNLSPPFRSSQKSFPPCRSARSSDLIWMNTTSANAPTRNCTSGKVWARLVRARILQPSTKTSPRCTNLKKGVALTIIPQFQRIWLVLFSNPHVLLLPVPAVSRKNVRPPPDLDRVPVAANQTLRLCSAQDLSCECDMHALVARCLGCRAPFR